jgi:hypothetical protein
MQVIVDLKRDFVEQLSEIGFIKGHTTAKQMKQMKQGDGVLEATGEFANANSNNVKIIRGTSNYTSF